MVQSNSHMSRTLERINQLAEISDSSSGISRLYLSPAYKKGLELVAGWMKSAGMTTWVDEVGNQWGRYEAEDPNAPILIIGSHLDTVPNSGRFDGILGVLLGVEVVAEMHSQGKRLPFHIEVVGFGDEEGVRFEASMLGSYAVIGQWDEEYLELTDNQGISLNQALEDFGLDPKKASQASRAKDNLLGYWEVHMEQGPVLEYKELPVGVVSAIAGARRFTVSIEGHSGHAGTVPMELREDALAGAAEVILVIEKLAQQYQIVATVGRIQAYPGAVNVIPGLVDFTVDIRSEDDALREKVINLIFISSEAISLRRRLDTYWKEYHCAPAKTCHKDFRNIFEATIIDQKIHPETLVSGAGHDAMNMANITDIGMLFVRCKEGISHHPDESVTAEDIEIAKNITLASLDKLANCVVETQIGKKE